jgi:hypothetical protein
MGSAGDENDFAAFLPSAAPRRAERHYSSITEALLWRVPGGAWGAAQASA